MNYWHINSPENILIECLLIELHGALRSRVWHNIDLVLVRMRKFGRNHSNLIIVFLGNCFFT